MNRPEPLARRRLRGRRIVAPSVARLDDLLANIVANAEDLSPLRARALRKDLERFVSALAGYVTDLDPVRRPESFFDPADPRLFGAFAAIAMIGQARVPLASVERKRFYGSGIYALYYDGPYRMYVPIAGKEHPIYVGKVDPLTRGARTPKGQGTGLCARLNEHRKNIVRVTPSLKLGHFECRYLVVASGWQGPAEDALKGLFMPLWNKESNVIPGFGKHGDSSKTRRHPQSRWDILHPGRRWAKSSGKRQTVAEIRRDVREHLRKYPVVPDVRHILRSLLSQIKTAPIADGT